MLAAAGVTANKDTPSFHRDVGRLDFTLLVIGAVVGADIYVVASMGASFLGPAQLVAWVAAGILAAVIALAFVQCAAVDTAVGGSYGYARTAFGPFVGFLAGWALYVGEWIALPVFPLAFTNYLLVLFPDLSSPAVVLVKIALIGVVTATNLAGVRQGARLNDILTLAKLVPLAIFILIGLAFLGFHTSIASAHMQPFAPLGWSGFGHAMLPIFWAFAGFELAVLPSAEVRNPESTLPFGLVVGMGVATVFYLLTALIVVASLAWPDAAASSSPLAASMKALLETLGGPVYAGSLLMSLGAVVSIAGVYDVFTLGVSRLSFALANDGLFPSAFRLLHPKFGTPYLGLAFQAAFALLGSILFDLRGLITIAVFFLGFNYLLTAGAAIRLNRMYPAQKLKLPGLTAVFCCAAIGSVYLSLQAPLAQIEIGVAVMLLGCGAYALRRAHWLKVSVIEGKARVAMSDIGVLGHDAHTWLLRTSRRARTIFAGFGTKHDE